MQLQVLLLLGLPRTSSRPIWASSTPAKPDDTPHFFIIQSWFLFDAHSRSIVNAVWLGDHPELLAVVTINRFRYACRPLKSLLCIIILITNRHCAAVTDYYYYNSLFHLGGRGTHSITLFLNLVEARSRFRWVYNRCVSLTVQKVPGIMRFNQTFRSTSKWWRCPLHEGIPGANRNRSLSSMNLTSNWASALVCTLYHFGQHLSERR